MDCILKGDISITDNFDFIRDIITSPPNEKIKVISLEEVPTIDTSLPNVIGGALLLPPIEAMMAAVDGDAPLFTQRYVDHLNNPAVSEMISILITALYRGTNLILFYSDDIGIKDKIKEIFWSRYGIGIGEVGQYPATYDVFCTPIHLESIFDIGAIDPFELLYLYPEEALMQDRLIYKLVIAIRPIGDNYQERAEYILNLRHRLKENRKLIVPFVAVQSL
jgi:hypothetical protein